MPVHTIRPFLLFEGQAEAAMNFYTSLFADSRIVEIARYGPGGPGAEGTVMKAVFALGDQTILCTDSIARHDFTFTPAISFFVDCASEDEVRRLATALADGGREFMPLGNYGFSRLFAWVGDRFGISWQLNFA